MDPFFPLNIRQTTLSPTAETKTALSDSAISSSVSVYYSPPPIPGRTPQCQFCLKPHSSCPLALEADRDRLLQVWEKNFQARQAERDHWSPRGPSRQSSLTGVATARVFNTEGEPSSTDTAVSRVQTGSESGKEPGDF